MAGNRANYEQAILSGHNAAWERQWTNAVVAYGQAIQEFPEDAEAHLYMGMALLEMGRLEDALMVYTRAHQLNPRDPIPLEKSADVLERVGRLREAAQQYVNVAEIYLVQRDLDKAIGNWQQATRLTPGLVAIHAKLAQAFERLGQKSRAVREYLVLAANFQRLGDQERAQQAAQRALRLDPKNVAILNAMRALEAGAELVVPPPEKAAGGTENRGPVSILNREGATEVESDPRGPMGEAMTEALGILATYVMESGLLDSSGADALQALELQRQGGRGPAIEAYQRAQRRLNHPSLQMNLGGLLVDAERYDEAVKPLGEAALHPQLSAGAFHAMGIAYSKLGKHKQAINFLLQAAQTIDMANAAPNEDEIKIGNVYDQLLDMLQGRPADTLAAINNRYLGLLTGKEWKIRIGETRRQLQDTMRSMGEQGVVDILVATRSDELTEAVGRIDRYMRQGLYILAMDEAHRAAEYSPLYLPVHVRMAEIMMREGRVRQAINKYNVIAKTYLVRGENDRAASILSEVLEMAPLDISVRESLIELLETEQRWEEALDQYVDLADTHHQLGNFEKSRDVFSAAERLASRVNATPDKLVRIKHRMADIDQMRLDIRRAQRTYEEIVQIDPNDERAHRMLVEIHYRQNNPIEAIKMLDALLRIYARAKQTTRIVQQLEELVTTYPNDTGLRSRLAAIYTQLRRNEDAIRQLDALGELQLEAGLHQDAINTIRQIVAMNPQGVEDYRKLLAQLGG